MRPGRFRDVDESGAAIVELVMAVPVLLLFIFAVIDLTVLMQTRSTMDTAATAAVRYVEDRPELFFEKDYDTAAAGGGEWEDDNGTWASDPAKLTGDDRDQLALYLDQAFGSDMFTTRNAEAYIELTGDTVAETYNHKIYPEAPTNAQERSNPAVREGSRLVYQPFRVVVEYTVPYKTPLGSALESMTGSTATYSAQAGSADLADGASW